MCLDKVNFDNNLGRVEAWKLFSIDPKKRLRSAFCDSYFQQRDHNLYYEMGVVQECHLEMFYACHYKERCFDILKHFAYWNIMHQNNFVILPVVLHMEVFAGEFDGDLAYMGRRIWIPKTTIIPIDMQSWQIASRIGDLKGEKTNISKRKNTQTSKFI
jgi:hypothetical protein